MCTENCKKTQKKQILRDISLAEIRKLKISTKMSLHRTKKMSILKILSSPKGRAFSHIEKIQKSVNFVTFLLNILLRITNNKY